MDDQVRIRARVFSAPKRYAGCMIEAVPFGVRRGRETVRFTAGIFARNLARYFGLTIHAFFRAVRVEFGSHYLHIVQGDPESGRDLSLEQLELRFGYVALRLQERCRENLDYREAVDSLVEKYEVPPWRVFIGLPGEERFGTFAPELGAGEIALFVEPGEYR